ncbi:hypothetical protein NKR23_g1797 [Pleurostoma richardsiae]|uniref:VWFA domain-containing protein n=1 Tax=Pleurostoma richardsiae TaxID=41990 RepID=A0AA38RRS4_9PEZI|nr:hypothetical protein NKR23_g1797 [Pleurostoma richardsiae]
MTKITTGSRSSPDGELWPVKSHTIVTIVDDIAFFNVIHYFRNDKPNKLPQAAYTFPLPHGCAVAHFACHFGNQQEFKSLAAVVKPRVEARAMFQDAAQKQRPSGLLEQNTTEVFTATLGAIPAQSRTRTEITYFAYLQAFYADGKSNSRRLTLVIPRTIAHRYGRWAPEHRHAVQSSPALSASYEIVIHEQYVQQVTGNGEEVELRPLPPDSAHYRGSPGKWQVTFDSRKLMRGDFDLVISDFYDPGVGGAFFETITKGKYQAQQYAMLINIPPGLIVQMEDTGVDSDIVFLADRSRSMKRKMQALKLSMNTFLQRMTPGQHFNLWSFGGWCGSLWEASVEYNQETLNQAKEYVSAWSANMPGTELLNALKDVVGSITNPMTNVIVLTDGEVNPLDPVLEFVKNTTEESRGKIRFFALGIGKEVSHALLQGIANYGGGYCKTISHVSLLHMQESLLGVLQAARTRHVGSINVQLDGRDLETSSDYSGANPVT